MEDYSSMKHSDFIPDKFDLSIQRERERERKDVHVAWCPGYGVTYAASRHHWNRQNWKVP